MPINFYILGEANLYQYEFVFELGKEAENFTACHQFARCLQHNADAEVSRVALNLNAEEVWNGRIFSTQMKYTEQPTNLDSILGNYLR